MVEMFNDQPDWTDLNAVSDYSARVLRHFEAHPAELGQLLKEAMHNSDLRGMSEHYDILDKLVLYDDAKTGMRLRLHVFLPGYIDRPHNHRWIYSSLVLRGSYLHFLYGTDTNIETMEAKDLKPLMIRRESKGSSYTLHHTLIHSVVAEPYSVSLIVRGPSVKDRFRIIDKETNESWWQYGAVKETDEQKAKKLLTDEQLNADIERLRKFELI